MGLIRGMARTAAVAGTATAVSNRVSRRQAKSVGGEGPAAGGCGSGRAAAGCPSTAGICATAPSATASGTCGIRHAYPA